MMADKTVFDVKKIDLQALATAHGLMNAPKVSFDSDKVAADGSLIKPDSKNDRINKLRELAAKSKAAKDKAKKLAAFEQA
jgi:hypothetical protein